MNTVDLTKATSSLGTLDVFGPDKNSNQTFTTFCRVHKYLTNRRNKYCRAITQYKVTLRYFIIFHLNSSQF